MICFTKASARTVSTLRLTKTRSLGRDHLLCTFLNAFAGYWSVRLAVVFEHWCVLCFRYFMNLVCNNLWLRVCKWMSELLVKYYMWCLMLNDAILVVSKLVWNPSWFRLTTGIIWAQVRKFERFSACFCTCALIIWSVMLHARRPTVRYKKISLVSCYVWAESWYVKDAGSLVQLTLSKIGSGSGAFRFERCFSTNQAQALPNNWIIN
jgi:hypothetical protein